MFHFIKFDNPSQSPAHDKGILFETLCRKIARALGYEVSEFREKVAGAEYDITAHSLLQGTKLIGEAKALSRSIDVGTIKAFVGSLDVHEPETTGLFLSVSDLTPDAREYLRRIQPPKKDRISSIVGSQILQQLSTNLTYMSPQQAKQRAHSEFQMCAGDTDFLISDRGDFLLQLLIEPDKTRPSAFCVFRDHGELIRDAEFAQPLKQRLPYLKELYYLPLDCKPETPLLVSERAIGPLEGTGWFDYFLPAPPTHFIGRRKELEASGKFLDQVRREKSNIRVFQVLSRSGVGKSSFLLKLKPDISGNGISVIEDARNIKSSIDLSGVVRAFVANAFEFLRHEGEIPADTPSLISAIREIDSSLAENDQMAIFFIDQFEALFLQPELYAQALSLILEIVQSTSRIVFCLARKTDQPTTFDERTEIDLSQLMQISSSVRLEDFTRSEAIELVSHIPEEINEPLKDELRDMILEFSYGFPWLCKRICAHVISRVEDGISQEELIRTGLKPGDLFQEDLSRLDDVDRDYLAELVHYLPATIQDLEEVFPANVLVRKLDLFQKERLIRLTGRTYDTYNDVLKEYLKSGEVPNVKHVFRTTSRATFGLLIRMIDNRWTSVEEIADAQRTSRGGIYNKLRELKLLGLLGSARGDISVSPETLEADSGDNLASLIRSRVRRNGLVRDVLNELTIKGELTIDELTVLMQRKMPILDVSSETWAQYAKLMCDWLRNLQFVVLATDVIAPLKGTVHIPIRHMLRSSTFIPADCFLPSSYTNGLISLIESIGHDTVRRECLERDSSSRVGEEVNDGIRIGLIKPISTGLCLTERGVEFLEQQEKRGLLVRDLLLGYDNVLQYLDETENQWVEHTDALKRSLTASIGAEVHYTEKTWNWRSKVLANWLGFAGLVVRKEGRVRRSSQTSLWDQETEAG